MARVYSLDQDFEQDSDSRPPVSNYVAGTADAAEAVSIHTTSDTAAAQESVIAYAAVLASALNDEVTFLSGLNPDGTLAFYSYAAWNNDRPATYTGGYTLAYKWHSDGSTPTAGTPGGTVTYAFNSSSFWNADEQAAFTAGLALWSAVANISFSLTSDYGDAGIQFTRGGDDRAYADSDFAPYTQSTGRTDGIELFRLEQVNVSIDTGVPSFGPIGAFNGPNNIFSRSGGYPLQTIVHEIGHAIGLGHGGPYNGTKVASQQYGPYDTRLYSLMSYFNNSNANLYTPVQPTFWDSRYAVTPMIADILAIQRIYGTAVSTPLTNVTFGYNTNIAGPVANFFDFNTNTTPIVTLWAAGSSNTLDLSNTSDATVNLNPGTFSSTHGLTNNIAIAYDTQIDRLVGSAGGTAVTGNDGGNYIDGAGGDDVIHGGNGDDTLLGGTGADRIFGGAGINAITGGSESDTAGYALARAAYTITRNQDGSVLVTGSGVADTLYEIEYLEFADQTIAVTALDAGAILDDDPPEEQQMPTLDEQVTYISGVTSGGVIADTTSKTWVDGSHDPATYSGSSRAAKWGGTADGTSSGTINYAFDPAWSTTAKDQFRSALALYSAVANITFNEVASNPASGIYIKKGSDGSAYATGSFSGNHPTGTSTLGTMLDQDVSIDPTGSGFGPIDGSFVTAGGYPWTVILHEIGHALGLGHGGPYDGGSINPTTHQYSAYDSQLYSVMSYIDPSDQSATFYPQYPVATTWGYEKDNYGNNFSWAKNPGTLMPADIMALQRLYGAATSSALTNVTFGFNTTITGALRPFYDFTQNTRPIVTLWAAGTNNALDLSGFSSNATVNLNPGTFSSAGTTFAANGTTAINFVNNIAIAFGTAINTAIGGSGNDSITGNTANNIFRGNGGDDFIEGGTGTDTAEFSGSFAQYQLTRLSSTSFRIVDSIGGRDGTDTVTNVETLQFTDRNFAIGNSAPVVTTANVTRLHLHTYALSSLFSVSDADEDSIVRYQLWDSTTNPNSGYFVVNGVAREAHTVVEITAAELPLTSFVTGSTGDLLQVRAFDGISWSAPVEGSWSPFHVSVG